jgi:hypothetical protein
MATAIINSQMDAINESFEKISSDLTTIRPLLKNASIGAYPTDTASGSIASFTDGAEDIPVKSLSVDLEPIQNLNGQDSPYPAGGGKNKFNPQDLINAGATESGGVYTVRSNATTTTLFAVPISGQIALSYDYKTNTDNTNYYLRINYTDGTFTRDVTSGTADTWRRVYIVSDANKTVRDISLNYYSSANTSLFRNMQLEAGSTATAYAPYSNICPISGHTDVNVYDDPKYGGTIEWNQLVGELDGTTTWNGISITNNGDGSLTLDGEYTGTSTGNLYLTPTSSTISVISGHKYYINLHNTNVPQAPIRISSSVGFGTLRSGATITSPASSVTGRLNYRIAVGQTLSNLKVYPQVFDLTQMFGEELADYIYSLEAANYGDGVAYVLGLFPKDYYPYNAGEETCVSAVNGDPHIKQTVPLGQTVYGGTLNVTTGVLTVEYGIVDLGTLTWTYVNSNYFLSSNILEMASRPFTDTRLWCSQYATTPLSTAEFTYGIRYYGNGRQLLVKDARFADAASFKAGVNGVNAVYVLEAPITVQLTATQVSTLLGQNNIFSDSGDVDVVYRADVGLYIDKKLAQALNA